MARNTQHEWPTRRKRLTKPAQTKTAAPPPLPKITTDDALWHRLLRQLDYAVQQHVQGYSAAKRPRSADPGWEDLIELQAAVARQVQAIE